MNILSLLVLLSQTGSPQAPLAAPKLRELDELPVLVVTEDDTKVTESCRIVIPEGLVIRDANNNGVLHVESDGIAVVFAAGSVLRGAPEETPLDELTGTAIRISGHKYVLLSGLEVEGFHAGLVAEDCEWLWIHNADFDRHYAAELHSNTTREASEDWLWPHANDNGEWLANYGASVSIARSSHVELDGVTARHAQNGILFDRVAHSKVENCDASYLSGWGLAMWRSSDNRILGNRFDFCVRGYSHGVYNRGQDSAGILAFEQCSRNLFLGNSATHCGDGFFGFSGKEALGEVGEHEPEWYARRGNNANVFEGNDFSFAAAHGLELTFGFGNIIRRNIFRGNAICGVWGGYSQGTEIVDNLFVFNGDAGYGQERGGINIDHASGTLIQRNRFGHNAVGVRLWQLPGPLEETPWGRAQTFDGRGNELTGNTFFRDELGVELTGDIELVARGNEYLDMPGEIHRVESPAILDLGPHEGTGLERAESEGRAAIRMTAFGPWDGTTPLAVFEARGDRGDLWRLFGFPEKPRIQDLAEGMLRGMCKARLLSMAPEADGSWRLRVEARNPDASAGTMLPYHFEFTSAEGASTRAVTGTIEDLRWTVRSFASPADPREDIEAWHKDAEAGHARLLLGPLVLAYGQFGPPDIAADDGTPTIDHFGTIATTTIIIPAGTWRITTRSDDGVRLVATPMGGEPDTWIENWTQHAPTEDSITRHFESDTRLALRLEHFELDGEAWLELSFTAE
jgi:parallel beta-helix repeat protein